MRDKLISMISEYPKHYTRMAKKDKALHTWILSNSLLEEDAKLSEHIYSSLYKVSNRCQFGNIKKFTNITDGFGNCGRPSKCKCVANQMSKSISKTKQDFNDEKKAAITKKRKQTTFEKYGVYNNGQTESARKKHQELYNDECKVKEIVDKVKSTKTKRYGDPNYNNAAQIKTTWNQKSQDFWKSFFPEKDLETLYNPDELKKLFQEKTIPEIAVELNVHIQTVYHYLNKHKLRNPFQSSYEVEIVNYLKSLGVDRIIQNSRSILPSRKELDIYLPDYNIAIEFNGIYWHHEDIQHISRNYHKQKFDEAEQLGIQLITIFSNFWNTKKDVVKNTIKNKLQMSSESVYARKLEFKKVKSKDTKDFLNNNHIQGYTPASLCYALFDGDEMQAVMTFSKSRIAIGNKTDQFELVRYASKKRIVGGASKLLSKFLNEYPDEDVFSYSNNEWSNGALYSALGFELEKDIPVSYWYIHPKEEKLMHRFNYSKQKLVAKGYDSNLTEKEICKSIGLLKLWDCGKRKWVLRR